MKTIRPTAKLKYFFLYFYKFGYFLNVKFILAYDIMQKNLLSAYLLDFLLL